jgi:hypothetical protein
MTTCFVRSANPIAVLALLAACGTQTTGNGQPELAQQQRSPEVTS